MSLKRCKSKNFYDTTKQNARNLSDILQPHAHIKEHLGNPKAVCQQKLITLRRNFIYYMDETKKLVNNIIEGIQEKKGVTS